MARLLRLGLILVLSTAMLTTGGVATAAAATGQVARGHTSSDEAWVAQQVQGLLVANPGARQLTDDSVQVGDGVVISVFPDALDPAAPASASGRCAAGDLCLFQHINFGGYMISFYYCRWENLYNYYMGSGASWADQASSIDNPQYPPARSWFYHNSTGLFYLDAGHYLKDLTKNYANGRNVNDWITGVQVC